jgi:hypothetical protein
MKYWMIAGAFISLLSLMMGVGLAEPSLLGGEQGPTRGGTQQAGENVYEETFEGWPVEGPLPTPWKTYGAEVVDYPDEWGPEDPDIPGWFVVRDPACTGGYCLQSGAITHLQVSVLEVTLVFKEEGSVYYQLRGSSERFLGFVDGMTVYIDDERVAAWSGGPQDGFSPWAEGRHDVPAGEHTVRFVYVKDGSVDWGLDAVQLDIVRFEGVRPPIRCVEEIPLALGQPQTGSVRAQSFTRGTIDVEECPADVPRNYTVEVPPEGAELLAIVLEAQDGGNLDLYGRAGQHVEAAPEVRRVKSDFASISPGGEEILIIANPDSNTTYWFSVENREDFEQNFTITAWLLPEIQDGQAGAEGQVGVPDNLPPPLERYLQTDRGLLALQQYRLEVPQVPQGARLIIQLEGEGDLNLHVRLSKPVDIDDETGRVVADVSAISPGGTEVIVLSGNLLQAGTYYIAIEGLSPPQEFTLTVTLETQQGSHLATIYGRLMAGEGIPAFIDLE